MATQAVLLVEDNEDDIEMTRRSFQKLNFPNPIIVLRDGVEALDYLFGARRRDNEMPVLILLDLKLPKVDGFEVLRRIRSEESTRHIPVTMLTTSSENRDRLQSYRLGANSYIRKPMNYERFTETVRLLGTYWLTLNLLAPDVQPLTHRDSA